MLRFKVDKRYPTVVRYILEKRGWVRAKPNEKWNLYWRNGRFTEDEVRSSTKDQMFNHFLNSGTITKKAGITFHLKQLRRKYGLVYDIMPPSFVYSLETKDIILKQLENSKALDRMWIIKPSVGSQGRGIQIIKNLRNADIPNILPNRMYTAQLYLENPLLIQGYKFDIRLYALVTSFHPMTIYLYKEGLVRFATEKFDKDISEEGIRYRHLTNTSINKFSPIFKRNAELSPFEIDITRTLGFGSKSKRTLKQLVSYLFHKNVDFRPIWKEINKAVILSLLPLSEHVPQTEAKCFEIYGFDFILDSNFRPWLLEVNFSPSLGCECNVDQSVKENLIEDVLDTLNIQPLPEDESYKDRQKELQDFYNFMNRNTSNDGSYGNFEKIFPFNDETLTASEKYSLEGSIEARDKIVENVREVFGEKYQEIKNHNIQL